MRHPGMQVFLMLIDYIESVEDALEVPISASPRPFEDHSGNKVWKLKNGGCYLRMAFRLSDPLLDLYITNHKFDPERVGTRHDEFHLHVSAKISAGNNKIEHTVNPSGAIPAGLKAITTVEDGFHGSMVEDVAEWFANLELEAKPAPPASSSTGFVDMG